MKFCRLLLYTKFHKIRKFKNHKHLPNMVMSLDLGYKFRKFYFLPNSISSLRKTTKFGEISSRKKLTGKRQNSGWKTPSLLIGLTLSGPAFSVVRQVRVRGEGAQRPRCQTPRLTLSLTY